MNQSGELSTKYCQKPLTWWRQAPSKRSGKSWRTHLLQEKWDELERVARCTNGVMSYWDEARRYEAESLFKKLARMEEWLREEPQTNPRNTEALKEEGSKGGPAAPKVKEFQEDDEERQPQKQVNDDFAASERHDGGINAKPTLVPVTPARLDGGGEDQTARQSTVERRVTSVPACRVCQRDLAHEKVFRKAAGKIKEPGDPAGASPVTAARVVGKASDARNSGGDQCQPEFSCSPNEATAAPVQPTGSKGDQTVQRVLDETENFGHSTAP
jgi:hypothetical protein